MTQSFKEGATAHKRSTESATPSAMSKFSNTQLTRLMGWCGLGLGEQDKLPPNWAKIQATRDKEDARAVLTKHFEQLSGSLKEPLNIYFSECLVNDIINLRLAQSREPDYESAHLGIYVLAVIPCAHACKLCGTRKLR